MDVYRPTFRALADVFTPHMKSFYREHPEKGGHEMTGVAKQELFHKVATNALVGAAQATAEDADKLVADAFAIAGAYLRKTEEIEQATA